MKLTWKHILLAGAICAAIGAAVFWTGLINVGASTGHWAITDWLLHTAMHRSVSFRAHEPAPADYPTPGMVRRGAGHFEAGCAYCHGSPSAERSPVVLEMTPAPPDLARHVSEWNAEELFWIVKHGVKFTGMPAWPVQNRDDEVWSIVAFLEQLPGMTAAGYSDLAFGKDAGRMPAMDAEDDALIRSAFRNCVRCHGVDGRGDPNGAFPRLDIQSEAYLTAALEAYSEGRRSSGIMQLAVTRVGRRELELLARYYANVSPNAAGVEADAKPGPQIDRGRTIAKQGIPSENIAACSGCHDQGNPEFPRLAGQYRNILEIQLRLFVEQRGRGGSRFSDLMSVASHDLKPEDIEAVSAWYANDAEK